MNVLSLFDGMSCGQQALERTGIIVDNYFASEIDKYAIQVTMANYPDTIQLGSVTEVDGYSLPKIQMLIGGSPCTQFSFAGKRKGMYKSKEEAEQNINEGDTDYDRAEDAKRLGTKGEKNIYGAGVKKGEEIEKKKMKMSELKAAIKALAEGEEDLNINDDESLYDPVYEGVWSVLPARIPEFIQKIKDIKDEYHAVVGSDDVYDGLDHAISAAEELMNSKLSEAKKEAPVTGTTLITLRNINDAQEIAAKTKLIYEESWNAIAGYLVQAPGSEVPASSAHGNSEEP